MTVIVPGGEPFDLPGASNHIGCLLLHGYTATPQEMRQLGLFLQARGCTARSPLLPGHGTDVRELAASRWQDWAECAGEGMQLLRGSHDHAFVIGLSLGGALALHLAATTELSGAVALATPMIRDLRHLWAARLLKYVVPFRQKGPSNLLDRQALAARVAYSQTPTSSSEQLVLFLRHLWRELPDIQAPVLLMHSTQDQTVDPRSMPAIYGRLRCHDKEMIWLHDSGHIVTEDHDRQLVYDRTWRFLQSHSD
jgi:carboxylesterase